MIEFIHCGQIAFWGYRIGLREPPTFRPQKAPARGQTGGRIAPPGWAAGRGFLGPEGWGFREADSAPQRMAIYLSLASIIA